MKGLAVSTLLQRGPLTVDGNLEGGCQCYEGRTEDMVAGELIKVEYRRSITGFGSHLISGTSFQRSASWLGLSVLMFYFVYLTVSGKKIVQGRAGGDTRV